MTGADQICDPALKPKKPRLLLRNTEYLYTYCIGTVRLAKVFILQVVLCMFPAYCRV